MASALKTRLYDPRDLVSVEYLPVRKRLSDGLNSAAVLLLDERAIVTDGQQRGLTRLHVLDHTTSGFPHRFVEIVILIHGRTSSGGEPYQYRRRTIKPTPISRPGSSV